MDIHTNMQELSIEPMSLSSSTWSFEEDKVFESALLKFADGTSEGWQKIAEFLPGKTEAEVRAHYEILLHDLNGIETDRFSVSYSDDDDVDIVHDKSAESSDSELKTNEVSVKTGKTGKGSKRGEGERRKGTPWTKDEHRCFLEGLARFGKGDWRSIARTCVVTRTSTQVASHAQKYFIRQASQKKEKKRASIHDITTTETTMVVQPPPPTLTPMASPPPQLANTNFYGGQIVGPQMGFGYQQNFGYPNLS